MGMTKKEQATRDQLADYLGNEGHGKYAEYLMLFDLHFMSDKEAQNGNIAYMIPDKGMIFINRDIDDLDAIDLLLRHEMLHQYLKHGERYKKAIRKKLNIKDEEEPTFKDPLDAQAYHRISNMAADWELSKFYSVEKDFMKAKNIPYKDTFIEGLVLELDHPEWIEFTYEEIFDELTKEIDKIKQEIQSEHGNASEIRRSIEDQAQDMEEQASEMESQASEMAKQLEQRQGDSVSKNKQQQAEEDQLKKKIEELKKNAKQLKDQANELKKDSENRSAAFNEPDADIERKKHLDKIKDFWDQLENKEQLVKEIEERVYDDQRSAAIKQKMQADKNYIKNLTTSSITLEPMKNFILDLNKTIKKQLNQSDDEIDTFTKRPLTGTAIRGVYRAGQVPKQPTKTKPVIHVIYDRSGSWFPPEKTRAGDSALHTIKKKYVDKGLITLEVFYCSSGPVTSNRAEADEGGDGLDGTAVIDHLNKTKPDNVIIMTDSDPEFYDYQKVCRIPGAAWFLFYGGTAPTFAAHIRAKSKKYYDLRNIDGLEEITRKI